MTEPESPSRRIGGRYRLDERIGAGAMGAVWRGTDELLSRTVAVKELLAAAAPPTAAGGDALEESRQRILREGRLGARLQHPHVISMFDVVVHDDRPWLVMEYLPSKSLAAVLAEKGSLDPVEVATIGRQVADGLAAAHIAGVVHRDVKPGNVLIAEDGLVKLTDFGVSRAVDDVQLTRTGLIAGTPAFLSPEVARGREPTAASDIFALGATLYAAVQGSPPFGLDDNAYALLHKVATEVVPPPHQAGPLSGLLMWLLSVDPTDRPSAAQARDALTAVAAGGSADVPATMALAGAPPAERGATPAAAPTRGRRRRTPLLLGLLAALVAAVGVTIALINNGATTGSGGTPVALPPAADATTATPSSTSEPPSPTSSRAESAPPSPTPTESSSSPPAAGDPVGFVQNYYALLPGDTDAAFALLSPAAQQASGGRAGFENFYGQMESVTLQNARTSGEDTVDATVVFARRDGSTSVEPYRFVTAMGADGATVLQSFSRL